MQMDKNQIWRENGYFYKAWGSVFWNLTMYPLTFYVGLDKKG